MLSTIASLMLLKDDRICLGNCVALSRLASIVSMVVRLPYMHCLLTTDALAGRRNGVEIAKMLSTIASHMWFKDNRILSWDFYCSVSVCGDCYDGGSAPIHRDDDAWPGMRRYAEFYDACIQMKKTNEGRTV